MAPKGRFRRIERDGPRDAPAPVAAPVLPVRTSLIPLVEDDCTAVLMENYYTVAECERYMAVLTDAIDWKQQAVTLAHIPREEKTVNEPRQTLFMSNPGISYAYSGRDNVGVVWHPELLEIKAKAEKGLVDCGLPPLLFNCVQMNRYNHPRHTLGLHKDNEPDVAKGSPIASVNFGSPREFVIRHGTNHDEEYKVPLTDGSFFVMAGEMQKKYLHGVPVGSSGLRFNLTFRVCIPRESPSAGPPIAMSEERREGDWKCLTCGKNVFAGKSVCPCGAKKLESDVPSLAQLRISERKGGKGGKAGKTAEQEELRVDPDDRKKYTFQELLRKYHGVYLDPQIFDYWRDECRRL